MNKCRACYGLLRTAYRPVVCAPIVIQPRIWFDQGVVTDCDAPRVIPCPGRACQYLLEQRLTLRVPFHCGALVHAPPPRIGCALQPPAPNEN